MRPLVDGLKEEMVVERRRRAASTTGRWASTTRCGPRWREAAQPPRGRQLADAVIRDPEEHTTFDERGAVRSIQAADLTMPSEELDSLWSPDVPRAPRAHVLEVPLARLARPHPRRLHADGARGRARRAAVRAAALPRAGVRDRPPTAGSCAGASATACSSPRRAATRRLPRDRRAALPGGRAGPRAAARRGRDRELLPRASPSGSRAGSTPTRSRASTCWSPTASCARWRASSSRSRPSGASRRRARRRRAGLARGPRAAGGRHGARARRRRRAGHRRRHAVGGRRRARRGRRARARAACCAAADQGVAGQRAAASCGRGATGCAARCPSGSA